MGEPVLSIVTATYREPDKLTRTLESLSPLVTAAGTYLPFELIVVDSSPFENSNVLRSRVASGLPLVHLKTPPEGIYPALNAGLHAARGKYVWFLNGGDRLSSAEALGRAIERFDGPGAPDLVIASVALEREGRRLSIQKPRAVWLLDLVGRNRVCQQGVLYRRALFSRVGEFSTDFKLAADYDHHLRCLAAGAVAVTSPEDTIASYDIDGRSSQRYAEAFEEFRRAQRRVLGKAPALFSAVSELVRPIERARVTAFKLLGKTRAGRALRPIWHRIKR